MPNQKLIEEYRAKAEEAEAIASRFLDNFLRTSWLNIAAGYRELAKSTASPEQSSPSPDSAGSPHK